jgi:hypothetical protein
MVLSLHAEAATDRRAVRESTMFASTFAALVGIH